MDAQIVLVITMLVIGKACQHKGWLGPGAPNVLNAYVLNIALPALILSIIPTIGFSADHLWLVAIPWLLLIPSVAVAFGINRIVRGSKRTLGALLLCLPLGNTAYLGYPMVEALLGPQALGPAVIYDQFGSFIMLSTYALMVATAMDAGEPLTARRFAKRLFRFPPLLALLTALIIRQLPGWPPVILDTCRMVGATLVPVACLALGMHLRLVLPAEKVTVIACGIATRVLFLPALALAILSVVHPPTAIVHVAVLQSGMPTMIAAAALAAQAGFDSEICASMAGLGLLISLVTLPSWLWLMT